MLERRPLPKLPPESKINEGNMTLKVEKNEKKGLRKLSKAKTLRLEHFDSPRKSYDITNANFSVTKDTKTVENAVIEIHDGIGVIEDIETYDYAPPAIEDRLSIEQTSNSNNQPIEHSSNSNSRPIEQLSNSRHLRTGQISNLNDRNIETISNTSENYETTIHGYARNGPDYASSYEDLITTSASENIENYEPVINYDTQRPYELSYEEPDNTYNELVTTVYEASGYYEGISENTRVEENGVSKTFPIEVYQTLNEQTLDGNDEKDYDEKGYEVPVESISMESLSQDLK